MVTLIGLFLIQYATMRFIGRRRHQRLEAIGADGALARPRGRAVSSHSSPRSQPRSGGEPFIAGTQLENYL